MKLSIHTVLVLAAFTAFSICAEEHGPAPAPKPAAVNLPPPDKEKVSYALGMRLGAQRKESKSDLDVKLFVQGLKTALEAPPEKIKEADIAAVFTQAQAKGTNQTPQEKEKLAFAAGERMGLQLKKTGADLNADTMGQAIMDVADGKQTKIPESEVQGILVKAQEAYFAKKGAAAKKEGEAFLAKNAKEPGIHILPDGLQYKIIKEGTGAILKTNEHIFLKWKGMFLDGREFEHHNHFPTTPGGGFQCWQDALQRMKVGSKWIIYAPPDLSFGPEGEPHYGVGPDTTVMFELEVREIVQEGDPRLGLGRMGHGIEGRDDP